MTTEQTIAEKKKKILSITSVFEGSNPYAAYDLLAIQPDGPQGRRQISYGKHQCTEYSGSLKELLRRYTHAGGRFSSKISDYVELVGATPLWSNKPFIQLLKNAGGDPAMWKTQDKFFDEAYWMPAYEFFIKNGFAMPLSMAVIYDSYIHSGGVPKWLRKDFAEMPPAAGGDEKAWTTAYVKARDLWLENNKKAILRHTDYRTDTFLDCIKDNNWDLSKPVVCKFNKHYPEGWVTVP